MTGIVSIAAVVAGMTVIVGAGAVMTIMMAGVTVWWISRLAGPNRVAGVAAHVPDANLKQLRLPASAMVIAGAMDGVTVAVTAKAAGETAGDRMAMPNPRAQFRLHSR